MAQVLRIPTKACPHCQRDVAQAANACPYCRFDFNVQPTQPVNAPPVRLAAASRKGLTGAQIGGIAAVIIVLFLWIVGSAAPYSPSKRDAWRITTGFVSDRLKAPATAQFPAYSDSAVRQTDDVSFEVEGYVDSQNGFGALVRSDWSAKVYYKTTDNTWRADDIKIETR